MFLNGTRSRAARVSDMSIWFGMCCCMRCSKVKQSNEERLSEWILSLGGSLACEIAHKTELNRCLISVLSQAPQHIRGLIIILTWRACSALSTNLGMVASGYCVSLLSDSFLQESRFLPDDNISTPANRKQTKTYLSFLRNLYVEMVGALTSRRIRNAIFLKGINMTI